MQSLRIALTVAACALAARAQTSIGPFTGERSEDFSGPQQTAIATCLQYRTFGNTADVCTPGTMGCQTFDFTTFNCVIVAQSAPYFFMSIDGAVEIAFDFEVERFGGWFTAHHFFPDATVEFLDAGGAVLGTATATVPVDCTWTWSGWNLGAGSGVRRVRIVGTPIFSEGFVAMDDLQVDYGAIPPSSYCTAGTTTNGCVPSISASGSPNVTHTAPCQITVAGVEGQKTGIVFYGISGPTLSPWCSGGSSFLCVKAPTQRTIAQSSGGTLNACNGQFTLDWNAFQLANPSALGNPWTFGAQASVQGWFRDPPSCKTTNLSNALVLTYQ